MFFFWGGGGGCWECCTCPQILVAGPEFVTCPVFVFICLTSFSSQITNALRCCFVVTCHRAVCLARATEEAS